MSENIDERIEQLFDLFSLYSFIIFFFFFQRIVDVVYVTNVFVKNRTSVIIVVTLTAPLRTNSVSTKV